MNRRGPQPKRELLLARAVQARLALPREARPTMAEIATAHGVSKRQLQAAYAKHRQRVARERDARWVEELTSRLNARDTMAPAERRQRDEQIEARTEYELALLRHRKALTKKRSRKPAKR